jgi:hypothetical protein
MCLSSIFYFCAYVIVEEWFWHLSSSLFRIFVTGNGSGDDVVSGE